MSAAPSRLAGPAERASRRLSAASGSGPGVTLADVAREAGVSSATASRAISGRGPIAAQTRARVLAAVAKLEFEPSPLGRSLRMQTTGLVGVVVPDIADPFYAAAVKGIQHRLEASGYHVALVDTDERVDRETAAIRSLLVARVDGLVVCTSGIAGSWLADAVRRSRTPVVFFDNAVAGVGVGSVTLANEDGMRLLVDHLVVAHGHRRVAYVGGRLSETSGVERLEGFRIGLLAAGLSPVDAYVRMGDWTPASGARETEALLALDEGPTAIVYANARMAFAGLHVLHERGVRVPDGIALASFDDAEGGALLDPPLTALVRRDQQIGDLAGSLILRVLAYAEAGPMHVRIPMELALRRSCGCAGVTA